MMSSNQSENQIPFAPVVPKAAINNITEKVTTVVPVAAIYKAPWQ